MSPLKNHVNKKYVMTQNTCDKILVEKKAGHKIKSMNLHSQKKYYILHIVHFFIHIKCLEKELSIY